MTETSDTRDVVLQTLRTVDAGSADYPHQVQLTHFVTPAEVTVHLWAYLDESGLVIAGQDFGELVKQLFHDSDYEYWLTVEWDDVPRVKELLRGELRSEGGESVLELLKAAWGEGRFQTDTQFREWLDRHGIKSEFASYA